MGVVYGTPKQLQQWHQRFQVIMTNIIVEKLEILWELPTCDPGAWNEHILLEKWKDFIDPGLSQTFNL